MFICVTRVTNAVTGCTFMKKAFPLQHHLKFLLPTNPFELTSPCKAKGFSHDYLLPKILLKPNVDYKIQSHLTFTPINPDYALIISSFKINFNVFTQSTAGLHNGHFLSDLSLIFCMQYSAMCATSAPDLP